MAADAVRSIADIRALAARTAGTAATQASTRKATIAAFVRQLDAHFPATMAIPTAFAKLADFWKALGATQAEAYVRGIAREYWINVENGGSTPTSSTSPAALVVAGAPAATVDAAVPVYQRPWFPPVAATVVVGVTALVLFGVRRRRR